MCIYIYIYLYWVINLSQWIDVHFFLDLQILDSGPLVIVFTRCVRVFQRRKPQLRCMKVDQPGRFLEQSTGAMLTPVFHHHKYIGLMMEKCWFMNGYSGYSYS